MIFCIYSLTATQKMKNATNVQTAAGILYATSEAEAVGQLVLKAAEMFPTAEGWKIKARDLKVLNMERLISDYNTFKEQKS